MNKFKTFITRLLAVFAFFGLAVAARAADGDPDLSAVTTALTSLKGVMLTAAATVVTLGLALYAVKFGGVWVKKLLARFSS